MHVGIDATSIIYGRGVSRYTNNLIKALSAKKDLAISLYGSSLRRKKELAAALSAFRVKKQVVQSYPPSVLSKLWRLGLNPVTKLLPAIDVFHSWDWLQPPDKNLPLVSTLHDLAMLKYPETAHPKIFKMHQRSWKVLKDRQAQIIAVSRATKKDIVQFLGIPAHFITVVHEALPEEFRSVSDSITEDETDLIKTRLNLTMPYILAVGTREPRKNLKKLISAWKPLSKDYQLIIAGEAGWDETSGKKNKAQPNLRFLGRVGDRELAVLYAEAEVFAYPSLYEGFGLPILEAFHHGTPVVTSNVSSMPEVAGNAAELIDPESVESIRGGLEKVLNESLDDQKKRLQRMIIRQQMFSWGRVAEETIGVYEKTKII